VVVSIIGLLLGAGGAAQRTGAGQEAKTSIRSKCSPNPNDHPGTRVFGPEGVMHQALAQAILAHTMAQSTLELLALVGPFAIVFGAGAVLVVGPVIRSQGERYLPQPVTATATETAVIASAADVPPAPLHPIADPIPERGA
jgi:hypothetical protein